MMCSGQYSAYVSWPELRALAQQKIEPRSDRVFRRRLSAPEQPHAGRAAHGQRCIVHNEPRAFPESDDRAIRLLMKLGDSLLARYAHVGRREDRILIVRIDIERDEVQR